MRHLLPSCLGLSASMYLPLRHDAVEMEVCFEKVKQRTKEEKTNKSYHKSQYFKICWHKKVTAMSKLAQNKPDFVIWE